MKHSLCCVYQDPASSCPALAHWKVLRSGSLTCGTTPWCPTWWRLSGKGCSSMENEPPGRYVRWGPLTNFWISIKDITGRPRVLRTELVAHVDCGSVLECSIVTSVVGDLHIHLLTGPNHMDHRDIPLASKQPRWTAGLAVSASRGCGLWHPGFHSHIHYPGQVQEWQPGWKWPTGE